MAQVPEGADVAAWERADPTQDHNLGVRRKGAVVEQGRGGDADLME